jgi:hypothetical protein
MRASNLLFICCCICMLLLTACEDEAAERNKSLIPGRWELVRGIRNGKETQTLEGTFFEFGTDGKMNTNLPVGLGPDNTFELSGKEIKQKGSKTLVYTIQTLSDSTLTLQIELRGTPFELHLKRMMNDE